MRERGYVLPLNNTRRKRLFARVSATRTCVYYCNRREKNKYHLVLYTPRRIWYHTVCISGERKSDNDKRGSKGGGRIGETEAWVSTLQDFDNIGCLCRADFNWVGWDRDGMALAGLSVRTSRHGRAGRVHGCITLLSWESCIGKDCTATWAT